MNIAPINLHLRRFANTSSTIPCSCCFTRSNTRGWEFKGVYLH